MARTILIVDDDRELCELVSELLRGEGFEVDTYTPSTPKVAALEVSIDIPLYKALQSLSVS